MRAIGYARVSSDEQAKSGAGLAAQRSAIEAEAERHGWDLTEIIEDAGFSAKDLKRPGVCDALGRLERGDADVLVVSKLDRLSRSVIDCATLMEASKRQGWGLVALDLALDTTSPSGEAMAAMMAVFSQLERKLIGQRTREALEKKREQGVVLGRPRLIQENVASLIRGHREGGMTLREVAEELHRDGIHPPGGGAWRPSTLHGVLAREPCVSSAAP